MRWNITITATAIRIASLVLVGKISNAQHLRASEEIPPVCSHMPKVPYTDEARRAKFEGYVVATAVVMPDGTLANKKVVKSPGLGLDESVLKTMDTLKCKAGTFNGNPVPMKMQFNFNFRLENR